MTSLRHWTGTAFLSQKKRYTKNRPVFSKCRDIGLVWELHAPSHQLLLNAIIEECKQQFVNLICSFDPGFPALIVAASLGVTGTKNYAADNCWLSLENGLIYWAFVAPAGTVVFVSIHLLYFQMKLTVMNESFGNCVEKPRSPGLSSAHPKGSEGRKTLVQTGHSSW